MTKEAEGQPIYDQPIYAHRLMLRDDTYLTSIIEATLSWCNEMRAQMGMELLQELPKGTRYNGYSCPCGQATGLFVGRIAAFTEEPDGGEPSPEDFPIHKNFVCELPEEVKKFVNLFDFGDIPELIAEK